jgi:hypothetical protein
VWDYGKCSVCSAQQGGEDEQLKDRGNIIFWNLMFMYLCIISIIVNDDQLDATILAYLFIPNQLYMFGAMSSSIIRNT